MSNDVIRMVSWKADEAGTNNPTTADIWTEQFLNYDEKYQSRKRMKVLVATSCILFLQMCERITYYSVIGNMVLFCTNNLDYDTVEATTISLVFSGCVYLVPVVGGLVSDAWAGRFTTLLISSVSILLGVALLVVSAIDFNQWFAENMSQTGKRTFFISGLAFAAIGSGGMKANVSPFGAEQVEVLGLEMISSFFNWFYWITAVGSVIAYTGVAYIQQNISFAWGYFTPFVIMMSAVVLYISAKPLYTVSKPQGSALKIFCTVLHQGLNREIIVLVTDIFFDSPEAEFHVILCHKSPRVLNIEQSNTCDGNGNSNFPLKKHTVLDAARISHGGGYDDATVNGVLSVIKILPFCALVIMFWAIYSQAQSSFFIQALRMDVRVQNIKIPAAMLSTFTNVSIVIIIPVLDRLINPCMLKMRLPMTLLQKIGIGLLFSALAAVAAGIVEIYRKACFEQPDGFYIQTLANKNFTASSLTVFAQSPQFVLIGIGEIFTAATTLEAGYTQAPPFLQGLLTGLFYAASGIGNFLTLAIMLAVEKATKEDPWWGNEINDTKMENLMFLLAGLMAIDFIIFCAIAYQRSYRAVYASNQEDTNISALDKNTVHDP